MENAGSESVVLPDISEAEHLASEHDGGTDNGGASGTTAATTAGNDSTSATAGAGGTGGGGGVGQRVSVSDVRHGGVPVTLPVGSLIASTFNVITQDQLPHFKPMLCVDNGFIAADGSDQELKTTHIVIQVLCHSVNTYRRRQMCLYNYSFPFNFRMIFSSHR